MNQFLFSQRLAVGVMIAVVGVVSIVSAFSGWSETSNSATTTTIDSTTPALPSNFSATVSGTNVNFTWTDNANNESGFSILRQNPSGTSYSFGVDMNTQNAVDSNLAGGTYTYTIMAYNSYGNSGWSASVSTTVSGTDGTTPALPSNFSATVSGTNVNFTWTDNANNESGFSILRQNPSGTSYSFGVDMNTQNAVDSNLAGGTYTYTIMAYNSYGNSGWSPLISVTVSGDVTPPSVPTTVSVTPISTSSIQIAWAASTDNVAVLNYKIYRGGVNIGWTANLSYTDIGLSAGTSYSYTIAALDTNSNLSAQSSSVSASTPPIATPTPTTTPTQITTSTPSLTVTPCGSMTSGGGIKTGIYLIHGYNSEIYGRTDCVADSEQQIQWVTCVEAFSGQWLYPIRDNLSYSYTVKNSLGTIFDSGNWTPSYLTSMSSCPSNNGSGNAYTVAYNLIYLQPGTPYTFTISGINAGGAFSSTAVFRTKSSTIIPTIPTSPTTSTSITTPTPTSTQTPTPTPVPTPPPTITPTPTPTFITPTPTSTPVQPTSTPITQCLQAGGLWCYSDFPSSLSGYCAPAKSACERDEQAPHAVLSQPPAVGLRVSDQFLADRRDMLQDLRALERLVKRDIIEIDAKQLKIFKEKILSLKSENEGDSSALQAYREQIAYLQGDITTSSEREEAVDPRLEAGALKQLKQGLRLFERYIKTIEAKVTKIEKSKITIDAAIKETIASAKDMVRRVKAAKSYNDIRDISEQIPDVGQALNDALPRLEELLRLPRVLLLVDRRIADGEKAIKQADTSAKRLKLDVADKLEAMRGLVAGAKSTVVAVKTGGATEGLLDTLQEQVFDTLDEVFDLADHIRAVASVRQTVNQATADEKRYEKRLRRLKVGSEERQKSSELLGKFKEQLASLKGLSTQKLTPDLGDQIIDLLNIMADLKTELEETLGLSSPDATQEQIKRLFSAPNEKIKPFKVEQLEQGVL